MALRMPRPIAHASGVYHLNIRVPGDLTAKVKGTLVTLPVDGAQVTVRPSDKVIVSLRTKDPSIAKARFSEAAQALARHWDALGLGPRALTHKQTVALAGEAYRASVIKARETGADDDSVEHRRVRLARIDCIRGETGFPLPDGTTTGKRPPKA